MSRYLILLATLSLFACSGSSSTSTPDTAGSETATTPDAKETGTDAFVAQETGTNDATPTDASSDAWCVQSATNSVQTGCICKTVAELKAADASTSDYLNRCNPNGVAPGTAPATTCVNFTTIP